MLFGKRKASGRGWKASGRISKVFPTLSVRQGPCHAEKYVQQHYYSKVRMTFDPIDYLGQYVYYELSAE